MSKSAFSLINYQFILGVLIILGWTAPAEAMEKSSHLLQDTVISQICWQVYWGGDQWYRLGTTETMSVSQAGDMIYAWSSSLSSVPNVDHWVDFFSVSNEGGRYVLSDYSGLNLDSEGAKHAFEKKLALISVGGIEKLDISIPKSCNPLFAADTPRKTRMLDDVVSSIAQSLIEANKFRPDSYPIHLSVVIANFNIGYPETFVLVPSKRQVFVVSLSTDADRDGQQIEGDVVNQLAPQYGETADQLYKRIEQKVVKYGVNREINLDGRWP